MLGAVRASPLGFLPSGWLLDCMLGFIHYQSLTYQIAPFLFSGLAVRVLGYPYSLTSFGLCVGSFERLGNVYGYEGLALFPSI